MYDLLILTIPKTLYLVYYLMKVFKIISANIYIVMGKISKKRNRADSAENHKEETVAKKRKLKNSNAKQKSKEFLKECHKKTKKLCKINNKKGKSFYLKLFCFYIIINISFIR